MSGESCDYPGCDRLAVMRKYGHRFCVEHDPDEPTQGGRS